MVWEILLSASIDVGLGFLAEVGFGDAASELRERLLKTDQKKRQQALEQAFVRATRAAGDDTITYLLNHRPFQEEIVKALLDPVNGMDISAIAQYWGDKFSEHIIPLRRFFNALQNNLLEDRTLGEILERYQSLRFRQDVQKALLEHNLPTSDAPVVKAVSVMINRDGALAYGDGAVAVAVEAGGAYFGGDVYHVAQLTIQQFLGGRNSEKETTDARRRYLLHVSQQANLLPWTQLTTDDANPEQGTSLRLADVYIDLDTTELEPKHVQYEEELRRLLAHPDQTARISAQETLNRQRTLLVMGDPGSGKSTFVKYLAHLMAQASLAADSMPALASLSGWEHGTLFPLRVELRYLAKYALDHSNLTGARLLLKFIHQDLADWELEDCWPVLEQALRDPDGGALVLLDGLDEVPTAQRQMVVDVVNETHRMYPAHRYLVTCRPYAYVGQPWRLQGFHEVTLAPFNEEQIERFIDNWYERLTELKRLESRTQAAFKADSLKNAVHRRDLLGLAERPLLLTVMAQLHAYAGQLPEDRTTLYANAVELLLQRWEGRFERGNGLLEYLNIPGLKMSDLEEGLYCSAFNAHSSGASMEEPADIQEGDLCQWLKPYLGNSRDKADLFVEYIRERAGLLIRYKTEAYTFPHRSFQEFLAACHWLTFSDYPARAAELIYQDWDRWREVFVLAAGHAARTKRLGQAVAAVNALLPCSPAEIASPRADDFRTASLSATALLEIGLVGVKRTLAGATLLTRTRAWLELGLRSAELLDARARAEAGRWLGKLDDPRHEVTEALAMQFCHIPAGNFQMGSRKGEGEDREQPQHRLTLPEFWISRYPATNAQFKEFVQAGGYRTADLWEEARTAQIWRDGKIHLEWTDEIREAPRAYGEPFDLPNHPVVGITWYEALAFSRWLETRLRQAGVFEVYDPASQRSAPQAIPIQARVSLPSEAEWEKAARGTDGRAYPWGNKWEEDRCNSGESGLGATSAVGCFPHGDSPYGALEMSGNVWEWTRSHFKKYPYQPDDGRENLAAANNVLRVQRGGSFRYDRPLVRCAYRYWLNPHLRLDDLGFRVAVSPFVSGR